MENTISTITSKWQVTIPKGLRKEILLKVGQRIVWQVEDDKLVGRRIRSLSELSGSLKSKATLPKGKSTPGAFGEAAVARHDRLSKCKP